MLVTNDWATGLVPAYAKEGAVPTPSLYLACAPRRSTGTAAAVLCTRFRHDVLCALCTPGSRCALPCPDGMCPHCTAQASACRPVRASLLPYLAWAWGWLGGAGSFGAFFEATTFFHLVHNLNENYEAPPAPTVCPSYASSTL